MGQNLVVDEHALSGENAAEVAVFQCAALHDDVAAAQVFQNYEVLVAVGDEAFLAVQSGHGHVAIFRCAIGDGFQR